MSAGSDKGSSVELSAAGPPSCAEPATLPRKRPLRTDSLLHIVAARGQLDEIRRLVAAGYPVDLRSRTGRTPLHWANAVGGTNAAVLLRELGADPSIPDPDQRQVLERRTSMRLAGLRASRAWSA